ncbi:MAG: hypothetical protein HW387_1447 [Parachlamydiales bacterium]|nr:hypothetical protein [Parachlamydiales bacterium]
MNKYQILIWIFIAEAVLSFFLITMVALHRLFYFFVHRISNQRKKRLSGYFFKCIEENRAFDAKSYPGRRRWTKELLEVLESFNDRFHGNEWEAIKRPVAEEYLLPTARKWARSIFWKKRNQAARSFVLCPTIEDEKNILRLMDDRTFLVHHKATIAAIELESQAGIRKALVAIRCKAGSSRVFYRDALIGASHAAAEKMIAAGNEPALRLACLDVLSGKSWALPIPFLKTDLRSKNTALRRLAIRTLVRNPVADCIEILIDALKDQDEEVRCDAAKGLQIYSPLANLDCLIEALHDPSWFVRIEAARALKLAGATGKALLKKQTDSQAVEAVRYIEVFG